MWPARGCRDERRAPGGKVHLQGWEERNKTCCCQVAQGLESENALSLK